MSDAPTPGQLFDCILPPALCDPRALRGRRPVMVIGHDDVLGVLVVPFTTGTTGVRNRRALHVTDHGLSGNARVDNLRWVSESALTRERPELSPKTIRRVLSAARSSLQAIGQQGMYRRAVRALGSY